MDVTGSEFDGDDRQAAVAGDGAGPAAPDVVDPGGVGSARRTRRRQSPRRPGSGPDGAFAFSDDRG